MRTTLTIFAAGLFCLAGISRAAETVALKDVFKNDFLIGAALGPPQFCESSAVESALIKRQFNAISPGNDLKWGPIHPKPDQYDFTQADRYVDFGVKNNMAIIGHTLVWKEQTPAWVFQDTNGQPVSREVLLKRMRDHIFTVVGRYKGRIKGWDVVNEALAENGSLEKPGSLWMKIIGPDYIEKAYQFAHEADPQAELYYNDYAMESPEKRAGGVALIQRLQSNGIPITAVGLQGHYNLKWPSKKALNATIDTFARLGVKVMITELDVNVLPGGWNQGGADITRKVEFQRKFNPYTKALPYAVQRQLAKRYAELFGIFLKHRDVITRVTFWGVTDESSWLNNFPVHGRTNYPLLFDRNYQPKLAFDAVINVGRSEKSR